MKTLIAIAAQLKAPPEQDGVVARHELQAALQRLPADQREVPGPQI